jgi:hypothetical protein
VYEVQDSTKKRLACKVITLSSLKTKKAKTKVCLILFHLCPIN